MQHPFAPFLAKDDAYHQLFGPLARCEHAVRLPLKEVFDSKLPTHAELVAWLRENTRGIWFRIEDSHRVNWPGSDHDFGSLFYFENASEAVHFKLRWFDPERL